MADKKLPPGLDPQFANEIKSKDILSKNDSNMSSVRASRINSLHRSVEELTQEQNRKRMQVSSEISALTKQQQKMMSNLEMERSHVTSETAQAYSGVIHGLGITIHKLATGIKNITADTGKATTNAINQYGRAISEDISINKTNTVAMALSTATPLFGYFAGKFMETDVFQDAVGGIKDKVKNAMTEGVSKASGAISNIFRKGKEVENEVPKMQEGGYVRKGGLVEVHSAEIVTPVDKLMDRFAQERYNAQRNIAEDFVKEYKKAKNKKEENWQKALLKSIEELKTGMIGVTSRFRIALQSTLLQHPTFKNLLTMADLMKTTMITPLKFFFSARGGYGGDASKAMSTNNVFQKSANLLSLIYTTLMPKIDDLISYTKSQAEAIVGGPISTSSRKTYTLFDKIREFMTTRSIGKGPGMFSTMADKIGLDKGSLDQAGISGFSDLLHPFRTAGNMGISKGNILGKITGKETITDIFHSMKNSLFDLASMKRDQEKREGPHSPSMAQNIAMSREANEKAAESSEEHLKVTKGIRRLMPGWFEKIWDYILIGFGLVRSIFMKSFNKIKTLLGFGTAGAGAATGAAAGAAAGAGTGAATTAAGTAATTVAKRSVGARIGGALWTGAKKGVGLVGRMASVTAGGLIGGGMGAWDMVKAIREGESPEGFAGNWLARGFAGFLGGTDSGIAGAKRGVMKGGALGAAAGSIIPGLGTLLGGAVGALAGGILGFLGGKKISQAISTVTGAIKGVVKGVWNVVTFPLKAVREVAQSLWVLLKHGFKNTIGRAYDSFKEWLAKPGFLTPIISTVKNFFGGLFGGVGKFIKSVFGKITNGINAFAGNIDFPVVTMIKSFRKVRDVLDKNIEKIPVIGSIYRKIKSTVKSIHTGTMSSDLEAYLNQKDSTSDVYDPHISAKEINTKGMSKEEIIAAQTESFLAQKEIEEQRRSINNLETEVSKNINASAKNTQTVIANTTNAVSQTNNSVSNVSGGAGGGRNRRNFSSGYNFASQIIGCDLN